MQAVYHLHVELAIPPARPKGALGERGQGPFLHYYQLKSTPCGGRVQVVDICLDIYYYCA